MDPSLLKLKREARLLNHEGSLLRPLVFLFKKKCPVALEKVFKKGRGPPHRASRGFAAGKLG